jgi:Ca2+-binding RTX toxin-like protein
MSFTLGYIELPKMVYLAGNPTGDARAWNPATANGVLYLNMGDRNTIRGIGEGEGNELYKIERLGADANGEILRVVFSGRETIFKGVRKIVAFGGAGDDHIYVNEGVTSAVEFHGGDGNDVFIYDGSGEARLYGDAGDDYMVTGDRSTTAFLFGGSGMDYIVHNGSGRAEIDGGAGSDRIYGGVGNDTIHGGDDADEIDGRGGVDQLYGDGGDDVIHWNYVPAVLGKVVGGAGNDTLLITGTPAADDFLITSLGLGSNKFAVANLKAGAVAGSITGEAFEDLRLDARGGADNITIDFMAGSGLQFVVLGAGKNVVKSGTELVTNASGQLVEQDKVTTSDDRAADTVTILGHDGNDDDVTLSDTDSTDKGVIGIRANFTSGPPKIIVADSIRAEGDKLVISTRGGNDTITATALTKDRAALTIIAGNGNDILTGSRFNDSLDGGLGNDT